ncbi:MULTISPECIES: serine hydrolase [unclassified Ruegeria]|uniref:serine hydrolase domain-containing protein n=1 Tax=unclassified Ruegeria TaxID=2625375 RepID=UPI0014893856|nr:MULTISPECIES: serine hydrolase [unclassified Ruegeria]NOD36275.1 serine hydrolase [Ruegeria sp. HKCCD7296]NOE44316.1 serine hydrolase [Ruegeria sp. HKCCD7319]
MATNTKLPIARIGKVAAVFCVAVLASAVTADAEDNPYATADELGLMKGFPPPEDKRVNRTNGLFGVPYNRWSYQHMRELFPTANIPASLSPLPVKVNIDSGIERLTYKREDGSEVDFDTYLKETYTDAFVVIHGDRIVYERYLNGMSPNRPHQMMSVTKSFAGMFGLMAVANGSLSEEDPVTKYVPELQSSGAFGDATFEQVEDMTASLDFSEDYADPNSGITQYSKVLGLREAPADEIPADSIYSYLATLPKDEAHEQGDVFHYQTPKTDVVNWVTNRATGRSFQDELTDLWSKIGAEGETYVLLDKNGTLFAGGGLNATPRNLARFAIMMLNDGMVGAEQVVPKEVIQKLSDGADRDKFSNGPDAKGVMGGGDWSYRAQWWVRHTPGKESFNAIGVNGQWIYIDVERGVAIVKQSSQPEASTNYYDEYNINAYDAIIGYLAQ